jgi:2-oxoglutarate ferredoxin oxidoreductase subunit gamma
MTRDIILSGFGGQGVLTAGLMISEAAMLEGLNATYFPSYGAEMRGGTANCHVRISDGEIGSPVISEAGILLAMSIPALKKFLARVKPGGTVLYNSDFHEDSLNVNNCKVIVVKSEKIALERFGNSKSANMIMVGAFIKFSSFMSLENVKKAIRARFAGKGDEIVNINIESLISGFDAV